MTLSAVVVHDFMETYGGAERITAEIARAFPDAPVVSILGRREVARRMGVADRFVSLLSPRPRLLRHYRLLAPVFPAIVDRLRVPAADVVVGSSYAFAHRLRSINNAPRVCYSYGPLRFAWSMSEQYRAEWAPGQAKQIAYRAFAAGMRASDRRSARGIASYLAPGRYVADQIDACYGREAEIVGAPVRCDVFTPGTGTAEDYFLFCGRLIEPYKKVRMLVEAFNRTGQRLIVAGDGPERGELEALAGANITFTGQLSDERLIPLMQRCRAAVFPSADDFGLIPIEVMACGRPILAYAGGGALETVLPSITGEFFPAQTIASLVSALQAFDAGKYDARKIRQHALHWDSSRFASKVVAAAEHAAHRDLRPA